MSLSYTISLKINLKYKVLEITIDGERLELKKTKKGNEDVIGAFQKEREEMKGHGEG